MVEDGADNPTQTADVRIQQVENAVNFLSHPKVRGSTESSKRGFLVGKGLTEAEINEAFRRVPQVSVPIPDRTMETAVVLKDKHRPEGYTWTSVALGLGFTAAAVYSIKSLLGPSISKKIESWKRSRNEHVSHDGSSEREDDLARAVREQTEQMRLSLESLERLIRLQSDLDGQKEDSISQLRDEVRHLSEKLDKGTNTVEEIESNRSPVSYMEVLEMLEKGETPPGIRDDINDKPPDPTMSPPISKLKPVPKPWHSETNQMSSTMTEANDVYSEGEATTPSRRDLSGKRVNSIYQSIGSTPDKSPSVLVEQRFSRDEQIESESTPNGGSGKVDGSLGRKMMKNWRPPPLPTPSLSSPDVSSSTDKVV